MIFEPLAIAGVVRVRLEPHRDERGFFARLTCEDEFAAHALPPRFEQTSLSRNTRAGTLRGMHFKHPPHAESKLVRCVRGAIHDVVVDLRDGSATRGRFVAARLDAQSGDALYVPPGCAHGFQTLEDDCDVLYAITPAHRPGHDGGLRWDDPAFAIPWPIADPILSPRDAAYPDWTP